MGRGLGTGVGDGVGAGVGAGVGEGVGLGVGAGVGTNRTKKNKTKKAWTSRPDEKLSQDVSSTNLTT